MSKAHQPHFTTANSADAHARSCEASAVGVESPEDARERQRRLDQLADDILHRRLPDSDISPDEFDRIRLSLWVREP